MRLLYFIILFSLSSLVYGQKSTLLQNINLRAQELKHNLNKTEDSIVFKSESTIYEVMIYNDDFERIIKVKDFEAKIQISDLPVGRYAVEAVLRHKLIVITLLRNESFDLEQPFPIITNYTKLIGLMLELPKANIAHSAPLNTKLHTSHNITSSNSEMLDTNASFGYENNAGKNSIPVVNKPTIKNVTNSKATSLNSKYWVLYKINNGSSSEKMLKIADQQTVDRMIRKIKVDMTTSTGRLNELTVWEIYDTADFVKHKRKNKATYMNVNSDSFNLVPYFKIEHN